MSGKRQTISFTEEEFGELVEGEEGFEEVSDEIVDHRRWSVLHELIIRRLEDETFWRSCYEQGATENQWYDWDDRWNVGSDKKAVFTQVFQVEKTIYVYE